MEVFIEFITILLLYYALAFFGHEACGILVPQPSLNPWTTTEALKNTSLLDITFYSHPPRDRTKEATDWSLRSLANHSELRFGS